MTHLFIYGTLKRGGVRHPHLAASAFVTDARTAPAYRLLNIRGMYPGLVAAARLGDQAIGLRIRGEIWKVDDATLHTLDEVEGVTEGLYTRRPVTLDGFPPQPVQSYFWAGPTAGFNDLGDHWPVGRTTT